MPYYITGTATFASQANRDAALIRVNTALAIYTLTGVVTSGFGAGILTPTTTTITVSVTVAGDATQAENVRKAIYDAWAATNRHTSGWLASSLA